MFPSIWYPMQVSKLYVDGIEDDDESDLPPSYEKGTIPPPAPVEEPAPETKPVTPYPSTSLAMQQLTTFPAGNLLPILDVLERRVDEFFQGVHGAVGPFEDPYATHRILQLFCERVNPRKALFPLLDGVIREYQYGKRGNVVFSAETRVFVKPDDEASMTIEDIADSIASQFSRDILEKEALFELEKEPDYRLVVGIFQPPMYKTGFGWTMRYGIQPVEF